MMRLNIRTLSALAAGAFVSTVGIAAAGVTIVEPIEPPLVIPFNTPTTGVGGGAVAGSPQAISAALAAGNALALQVTAQGVPPLTAQQRAYAAARVTALISRTGSTPQLQALLVAIQNAPAAD